MTAEWNRLTAEIMARDDPGDGRELSLNGLRKSKDPETGNRIERRTMLAEVGGIVLGGMDTTGHQRGWIFALLAAHPHVTEKLLQELSEHGLYGEDAKDLQFEDLADLTYLTATIKEGMRIVHIVPGSLLRAVPRDMAILGYRVPKGTVIANPGDQVFSTVEMWGDRAREMANGRRHVAYVLYAIFSRAKGLFWPTVGHPGNESRHCRTGQKIPFLNDDVIQRARCKSKARVGNRIIHRNFS